MVPPVQLVPTKAGLEVGASDVLMVVAPIFKALTTESKLTPKILHAASGTLVKVKAMLSVGWVASTATPSALDPETVMVPPHWLLTVAPAVPRPVTKFVGKNPKLANVAMVGAVVTPKPWVTTKRLVFARKVTSKAISLLTLAWLR